MSAMASELVPRMFAVEHDRQMAEAGRTQADCLVVDLSPNVALSFSHPAPDDDPAPRRRERGDLFTLGALPDIALEAGPFLIEP